LAKEDRRRARALGEGAIIRLWHAARSFAKYRREFDVSTAHRTFHKWTRQKNSHHGADRAIAAIYGFSGGGYNVRLMWKQLEQPHQERIRKIW
jgi:hypothetical protein